MNKTHLSLTLAVATVATTVLAATAVVPQVFVAPMVTNNTATSVPQPPIPQATVDMTRPVDQALYGNPQQRANTAPAPTEEAKPTGTIKNPPKQRSTTEPKVKPESKLVPKPSAVKLDTVNKQ